MKNFSIVGIFIKTLTLNPLLVPKESVEISIVEREHTYRDRCTIGVMRSVDDHKLIPTRNQNQARCFLCIP